MRRMVLPVVALLAAAVLPGVALSGAAQAAVANTDVRIGMSSPADQWETRLAEVGGVDARRIFGQLDSPGFALNLARSEIAADRMPVLSFKVPSNDWAGAAAGRYDPALRDLAARLDALPGRLFVTIHHEPAGDRSAQEYAAMQRHVLPLLSPPENVLAGVIGNGFWWSSRSQGLTDAEIAQWLPADVLSRSEVVAADTYQGGTLSDPGENAAVKIRNLSAWAGRVGVTRLGIGEYNGLDAAAVKAAGDAVLADPRFVFACIFNSNENNRAGVNWQLSGARLEAFRETVRESREARGTPPPPPTDPVDPPPSDTTSSYVPLDPVRLLDTRHGTGGTTGPVGPGDELDLVVADGRRVPSDATAVVLNLTATSASAQTDVRVYPKPIGDEGRPTVSNLNLSAGSTVANLAHVKVGRDGSVRLRNAAGQVQLVADLFGYFRAGTGGATYVPAVPRRLLDTRIDGRALPAAEVRDLRVAGVANAAPAGATAVVLNVTAVGATRSTDLRVWPAGGSAPPLVSNLNPPPRRAVAAAVVTRVGDGGEVSLRSSSGTVHVVVDLAGWYVPQSGGAVFHAVPPVRLADTRATGRPLGPAGTQDLKVAGVGAVPSAAAAVVLNVTAVGASDSTDLRAYPTPTGSAVPLASNLNVIRGETRANTVVVAVGRDGSVRLRNAAGSVNLVIDLAGWYAPAGDG